MKHVLIILFFFTASISFYAQEYQSTITWDNGQYKEQGLLKDGTQIGQWKYWDEEGNLIEKREYVKGVIAKRIKLMYGSYGLKEITAYDSQENVIFTKEFPTKDTTQYEVTNYYKSGIIKSKGGVKKTTEKTGLWEYFNEKGDLKESKEFVKGEKLYNYTKYFSDGTIEKGEVNFGDKNGEWKKLNIKNEIVEQNFYIEGQLQKSIVLEYYEHTKGLLFDQKSFNSVKTLIEHRQYNFQDNNRYSVVYYDSLGNKLSSGKIFNGEAYGKWNYYGDEEEVIEVKKIVNTDTITIQEKNNLIKPSSNNAILKFYRLKKYPPSPRLKSGVALNDLNYYIIINGDEIAPISNGSFFEYEILEEGVYKIETSLSNNQAIHLFVKMGRSYFIECEMLFQEPEGASNIRIIHPDEALNEFNKLLLK